MSVYRGRVRTARDATLQDRRYTTNRLCAAQTTRSSLNAFTNATPQSGSVKKRRAVAPRRSRSLTRVKRTSGGLFPSTTSRVKNDGPRATGTRREHTLVSSVKTLLD